MTGTPDGAGRGRGLAAVAAAALGYATLPVLAKLALGAGADVWALVAWRFTVAAAATWVLLALLGRRPPSAGRWGELALLGTLYAVSGTGFLASLEMISAGVATLLFFTYPAVVVLAGALFLDETLTGHRVVALVLTVGGCALTAGGGSEVDPAGIGLALMAMAAISGYVLASRRALTRSPALGGAAIILTVTAAITSAVAATQGGLALGGGAEAAGWTLLTGLVGTAFPVTAFLVALKHLGAGKVALYSTVEPVITVGLAALVLGERMTPLQLGGGALVVAGVAWLRMEGRAAGAGPVDGGP